MGSRKDVRSAAPLDFHVGKWLAQPTLNLINRGDTVRRLEPQVMDLLVFLAGTGGRVVSKDEIIGVVWDGRFISDVTLTRSVGDLRRALGDDQRSPEYIETIAKRGYRLIAPVSPVVERGQTSDGRVADRLESARKRRFVGRRTEMETFRAALEADEPPFVVLHVTGAGGVGKTTLLEAFACAARDAGRAVVRLDGRSIEPSAAGLLTALAGAIGSERVDLSAVLEQWPAGAILLVDTCELLAPIDGFLRETLLPQLPARSLVVMAGRNDPVPAWRTDLDWAALARIHPLGNLAPDDSRAYLSRCDVPPEHHDEALAFTRGHPLALSLIADVLTRGDRVASCRLDSEPEVVQRLLERFVQDVPTRDHRLALHACATVWATTEPLLAAALGRADAHDLFEWLSQLSFIEHGPYGLFPHDLARDVVYADFRWRDPEAAYTLTERVLRYLYDRFERTLGLDRQRLWFDVLYVQRYNPHLRPYFEWSGFGTAYAETASVADHAAILEMVERHEGPDSAAIARYWIGRQPESFLAMRSVGGERIGFMANLRFESIAAEDLAADPAIANAVAIAERETPLRAGEHIRYCRFWMDREQHQAFTQALTLLAANCSQSWTAPGLAWCFVMVAEPDLAEPMLTEIHIWRTPEADFEVGGRRYGVFAHDWRVEPVQAWLRLKAERAWRIERAP